MMVVQADFVLGVAENGVLVIEMAPPTNITNWALEFQLMKRFGGSGLVIKQGYSGYVAGQSGITVTNAAAGVLQIALHPSEVSGFDPGTWAYRVQRLDSGNATDVSTGWRLMN